MATRVVSLPWERQPQELLELNRDHSLARGLLAYVIATPDGLVNISLGDIAVNGGSVRSETDLSASNGVGRRFRLTTGSVNQYETVSTRGLPALTSSSKVTIYARGKLESTTVGLPATYAAQRPLLTLEWVDDTNGLAIALSSSNSLCGISALPNFRRTGNVAPGVGVPFDAFVWNTGNLAYCTVNGVAASAPSTSNMSASATASGRLLAGNTVLTTAPGDRTIFAGGAWSRLLTDTEKRQLSDNPYILVADRRIPVPVSAAAPSVPTLSASTYKPGTLTSSGWQPRITAT